MSPSRLPSVTSSSRSSLCSGAVLLGGVCGSRGLVVAGAKRIGEAGRVSQSGSLLKCCANFICKLWQKRGLYANLHGKSRQGRGEEQEQGRVDCWLCHAWFWFAPSTCAPLGHLTLFLMMCTLVSTAREKEREQSRDNTHGKYLENAAQLQRDSSPSSCLPNLLPVVHQHFGTFIWRKSVKF